MNRHGISVFSHGKTVKASRARGAIHPLCPSHDSKRSSGDSPTRPLYFFYAHNEESDPTSRLSLYNADRPFRERRTARTGIRDTALFLMTRSTAVETNDSKILRKLYVINSILHDNYIGHVPGKCINKLKKTKTSVKEQKLVLQVMTNAVFRICLTFPDR